MIVIIVKAILMKGKYCPNNLSIIEVVPELTVPE